jgi:glycosyltransferase involved in cell wall biosynthesis
MPPAGTRITYVLLDFPIASEQFIIREVKALLALGARIQIVTIRSRQGAGTLSSLDGMRIDRPRPIWTFGFWLPILTESMLQPRKIAEMMAAAFSLGAGEGWFGRIRAIRLALMAVHFTKIVRRSDPAIIHAHFASAPATLGLLLSQSVECPFTFSTHARDLYAEQVNFPAKAARASHIFACSRSAADDLRQLLPVNLRPRVHAIYHGVDLAAMAQRPVQVENRGEPLILAVGRFEPKKGFSDLVQACALLRDERLLFQCEFVGSGAGEHAMRDQIQALGLHDRVRLVQWCQETELTKRYLRAAALAVPSVVAPDGDRDNIPNVILEALAHGTPIVASALPPIAEVLGPAGAAILVPPHDVRALADALRQVCTDADLANRLREQGFALVTQEFDVHANARRLLCKMVA